MLHSHSSDFSFSGLKTAVLYLVRDIKQKYSIEKESPLSEDVLELICYEFEEAIRDVLRAKLQFAYEEDRSIQTLIVAGGVIANTYIRKTLQEWCVSHDLVCFLPTSDLATDNAVMIGLAGVQRLIGGATPLSSLDNLTARGGWRIDDVY